MFITLNSAGNVGPVVDAFEQSTLAQMPETARAPIVGDLRAMQKTFDVAATAAREASKSRELTALGQRAAVTRVLQQAAETMKAHDAKVAKITGAAAEARAKAMQPPATERTQEVLMLEREIRDRLAGKDALEVNVLYVNAIASGDWTTVTAIERAPAAFALITPDQREVGDMMKLRSSPLAAQVIDADKLAFIYQSVSATIHAELAKLAEQFGVDFEG
jgi:hypothetical protein